MILLFYDLYLWLKNTLLKFTDCTSGMKMIFFKLTTQFFLFPKENLTVADSYSPPHLEEVNSAGHLMSSLVCARCLWLRTLEFVLFLFGWSTACAELPSYFICLTLKWVLNPVWAFCFGVKCTEPVKQTNKSLRDVSIEERKEKPTHCFLENIRAENTVPRTKCLKS